MFKKRLIAAVCTAVFAAASALPPVSASAYSVGYNVRQTEAGINNVHDIIIDGTMRNTAENSCWRGFGMISANNSSRLLLDYKYEYPEVYRRLLTWMFSPDGPVRMGHLKIEMGADINSSSGTEPSTMRSAEDAADVTRGMGFQLAADAKAINPGLTLELISWGAPGFVNNAQTDKEGYELRYQWFKKTLDAAYSTYGLKFDYIDPNYSERTIDSRWIKYFSKKLKNEKKAPYDYSKIKIVAADEDASYNISQMMIDDPELRDTVDVIGIHYTSTSDENTFRCKESYGKELWYSEGLAPAKNDKYAANADESGLGGVNSVLDVAGRIVNMYPNGGFNMYEFSPAIAAYYGGANYFPKQLITANEPWSGYTEIGTGMYMCEHFSLISRAGWQFIDSGCYGNGTETQHILTDTTDNYMTFTDPDTGDYSTVFVNNTPARRSYAITVRNLAQASGAVHVWETRGPDGGDPYNANYLKNTMSIEPTDVGNGEYTYRLTIKPFSMVTVSTLEVTPPDLAAEEPQRRLSLPYTDSFEYADKDDNYLSSRGMTPRYTTDLGGAFEVAEDTQRGHVLKQMITNTMRGREWGATPDPVTTFGDDTWANYGITVDVKLDKPQGRGYEPATNYVGVGLRYINASAASARSGYWLKLLGDGEWKLCHMQKVLSEGVIEEFDANIWHKMSISAAGDVITAAVDGVQVTQIKSEENVGVSGRAALYSAYCNNCFDDINIVALEMTTDHIVRLDGLDKEIIFEGNWEHNTMASYTNHNRTVSKNDGGGSFSVSFEGDSLALIGTSSNAKLKVELDGEVIADGEEANSSVDKAAMWYRYNLGYSEHEARITVLSGSVELDAIEYGSKTVLKNGVNSAGYLDDSSDNDDKDEEESTDNTKNLPRRRTRRALAVIGIAAVLLFLVGQAFVSHFMKRRR